MPILREALAALPSGESRPSANITADDVSRYLRDFVLTEADRARKKEIRARIDLYCDRGSTYVSDMLDSLFKHAKVRDWRKKFEPYAKFQNLCKRVTDEVSRVYQDPAQREVSNDEPYQDVIGEIALDEHMRFANAMVTLCNAVWLYPWVSPWTSELRFDVLTPDRFTPVPHPLDSRLMIGVVIETVLARQTPQPGDPWYLVWTADERFQLTKDGRIVPGSYQSHALGLPGVLVRKAIPPDGILDSSAGADLISAQMAITLINIMMLRAQKASVKTVVASGTGSATTGQALEEETAIELPDGSAVDTLDLTADPDHYITAARAVIKQVAANYGIPESVFDLSYNATSGFEITLKRQGLAEKRREQIVIFRRAERDLARVMERVYGGFSADGWRIDFGEIETPQSPMDLLNWLEKLRQMSIITTLDIIQRLNPDLDQEAAAELLMRNAELEEERNRLLRPVREASGAPMPADNANQPPPPDDEEQDQAA